MPFLLPALVALPSDAVIVFLGLGLSTSISSLRDDDDDDNNNSKVPYSSSHQGGGMDEGEAPQHTSSRHWVYRVYYLVCLASIRMFLVLVPLLFHSYTGTALRCATLYQLLYWGTLAIASFHMLALSLRDPESLEAVIPLDSASTRAALHPDAVHELRRIWYILILTIVSDICHLVILYHVRSTAPYNNHPLLNSGKTKPPSVYFTLRSRGGMLPTTESANGTPNGSHHEAVLMNAMTEFVDEWQLRLQRTKADWGARLEDFTLRLSHSHDRPTTTTVRSLANPLAPLTPFRVLLQLFADENVVVENGKLDAVFDDDDGSAMTFFVPQLMSFLLHGALYKSQSLEEWILGRCRRNVHFAHRCYWFLRSWCLEAPAEAVMMSRPNSDSQLSSREPAPFLDEPASPQESIPCHPRAVRRSYRRRSNRGSIGSGGGGGSTSSISNANHHRPEERLLPEERAMIERLMLRVKECGEESAVELAYGVGPDVDGAIATADSALAATEAKVVHFDLAHRAMNSPSDLMDAVESGIVPVDPTTGRPSVKHLDSVSAKHRFGFLPIEDEALQRARSEWYPQRHDGRGGTTEFDKTPQFLDALLCLADSLFHVPPKERRAELRRQLRMLECELLPSNSVYVPIGNVHHRVWRIVVDESVCIGTKERVPCIVCLEVVDYPFKKRRPRAWSFLDRLPKRAPASSSRESMENEIPMTVSPNRRVSNEGIELPDIRSEAETINEWRFSRRDPRRRSSIFDVVSSTVRESMKGPLDKMKTQMKSAYPDRPTDEELKSLTVAENFASPDCPSPDVLLGKTITFDDADDGVDAAVSKPHHESIIAVKDSRDASNLSRVNSAASIVSMGQWTSPTPAGRSLVVPKGGADMDDSGGVSLPYGSDQDEEHSRRKGSVRKVTSNGLPPVVFRESWQSKQNRLRSKSAYGHHPGWKLVPVLIKANDDLRQEQLASQLIYRMAAILSREKVPVWLCPYEIIALTESGGIVEAIPDTISLDSLKRNDPNYHGLKHFFLTHFGDGTEELADAQANFVESLAAYSIVCFLLQLKDRHNGNILLDNRGHIIHIDFGFFFLSSPGKNAGFESAPFKLTRDFVELLGGPNGRMFRTFRELCVKAFLTLRKHCMEIILLVEMLKTGNEELNCFRGRPDEAIRQLRDRFRLDLNDRACREYVNCLVDDSIENWRTDWYDRYQRYFVGVL